MAANSQTGINANQEQAAIMLAAGHSVTETAAAIGVNRTTVSEWQNIPAFEALVNQLRMERWQKAKGRIFQTADKAAATLERLLDSNNERIALAAATTILAQMDGTEIGGTTSADVEQRRLADKMRLMQSAYKGNR